MKIELLTSLVVLAPLAIMAQEVPRGMSPLTPQYLLAALPKAPEGWTMKMSTASTEVDDWLEAHAERVFEKPAKAKDGRPALVRVSVHDTAKQGVALENFVDFKVGPAGEGVEGLFVNGMPAYRAQGSGFTQFEMLVDGRFVIEILMRNSEETALKEWLDSVRVSVLRGGAARSREIAFPQEIKVTEINELDPSKSVTYVLAISTGDQIDRQLLEDERFEKMIDDAIAAGQDIEDLDLSEFE